MMGGKLFLLENERIKNYMSSFFRKGKTLVITYQKVEQEDEKMENCSFTSNIDSIYLYDCL